jgi:small subunit ribosomal protein S5
MQTRRRGGDLADESPYEDHVVKIYRCAKVVKGGRRFRFAALVIVGDRKGNVGIGYGKANEVPAAVEKGIKDAQKNVVPINLRGATIPHRAEAEYSGAKVVLVPASEGTGVIAGVHLRPLLELAGIRDVLTKSHGSANPKNLVAAGMAALQNLRTQEMVSKLRGVNLS